MPTHADNNRLARQRGFPDAQTMIAFYEKQRRMRDGREASPSGQQMMDNALAWHPAVILQWVSDKYRKATGN
jgi:hypothetical protein